MRLFSGSGRCLPEGASWNKVLGILLMAIMPVMAASAAVADTAVEVLDDLGNVIRLERSATRVVALAPHIVEVVYAVGSGDRLVGAVDHSNYPEDAQTKPRVGSYVAFSTEAILRLQPDLVLAWYSGNDPQRVAQIKALGIPVYYTEPRRLQDIGQTMEKIGVLTGSTTAQQQRQNFDLVLKNLSDTYANRQPLTVFYQVWNKPLQTLSDEHMISDIIRLCGGRNVFAEAQTLAPQISVESVLRLDPQVIVASGMAEERPEWLDDWRRWPSLQAVKNEQLKFIPPDIIQRSTPRILDGAQAMCAHLQNAREFYYP
jgi:iron complex transport system substrate-binding protein